MKTSRISKHLPEKRDAAMTLVQARVEAGLKEQVGLILEMKGLTWSDLVRASLKAYLKENEAPGEEENEAPGE